MMQIAFLIPTLDQIGGAEQQVKLLAAGLAQRGHRVTVIALSGNGAESAVQLAEAGVGFVSLKMRKGLADPRGWLRLSRWLRQHQPEVLHAHLPHAIWMARWSRLLAHVPVVIDTIHTSDTGTWGRRVGYRASNWLPNATTVVSGAVADAYATANVIPTARMHVLPNGVDLNVWQPDAAVRESVRRELGFKDEFFWFAAGRLDAVKDYPTLLKAIAQLHGPARLVIAGTGPLEPALRSMAADLGIATRTDFLGFRTDPARYMQAADGFVLTSLWEGLPMALLEAAACGVPAVATDVPGSWETIVHGQTGLLAQPRNPEAVASAMNHIMRMAKAEREEMGSCARKVATERFSLERVLDRWEAVYRQLLESATDSSTLGYPHSA